MTYSQKLVQAMFDAEIKETQETCCSGDCTQGRACPLIRNEAEQDEAVKALGYKWVHRASCAIGAGFIAWVVLVATGVIQ